VFVRRQVEQRGDKEVQQYMNEDREDSAVFSLNAAQMLFPALIMPSIKCDLYFVYFACLFPISDLL